MNSDVQIKQTVQEAAFLFPLQQSIVKKKKVTHLLCSLLHSLSTKWFMF